MTGRRLLGREPKGGGIPSYLSMLTEGAEDLQHDVELRNLRPRRETAHGAARLTHLLRAAGDLATAAGDIPRTVSAPKVLFLLTEEWA